MPKSNLVGSGVDSQTTAESHLTVNASNPAYALRYGQLARQSFIGGSDARIIMGQDEAAMLRLWREKRGELEPLDLSGNLIVQLGVVTEPLNRHWFERNTRLTLRDVQRRIR